MSLADRAQAPLKRDARGRAVRAAAEALSDAYMIEPPIAICPESQ